MAEPDDETAYARVMAACQARGIFFARGAGTAELKAFLALLRATARSHIDYRIPGRVRCPIHLIRARDNPPTPEFTDRRPMKGWAGWSEQEVVSEDVPGTHISMMMPPHVAIQAARLAACLASIDPTNESRPQGTESWRTFSMPTTTAS